MVDTIEREEEDERAKRIQREARQASGKIAEFKITKSSANSERIANHILEATKSLFRKDDLITNVELDPETFAMTLKDSIGTEINPNDFRRASDNSSLRQFSGDYHKPPDKLYQP